MVLLFCFALYIATSYQLGNGTNVFKNLPVFASIAFVIGNPGLQKETLYLLELSDCLG